MNFDWYKITSQDDFLALGVPSKAFDLELEDIGQVTVLVTSGNRVGILYDGVFLAVGLNGDNPFEFDGYAVFLDENDDIYLGVAQT